MSEIIKGESFIITDGFYDAYHIVGNYLALKDLCVEDLREQYFKMQPITYFSSEFLKWLYDNKYMVKCDCNKEMFIGDLEYFSIDNLELY